MNPLLKLSRRARWAVPAGVVGVTAAVTAVSMITVAQASPELPARSPAQLLAAIAGHTGLPPALTGTVVETASLGIPSLPDTGDPTSITSLLAGSHTIKVWYADPAHIRLAVPVTLSETDVIRNGSTVWLWQSRTNSVTRMRLPAMAGRAEQATPVPAPGALTPQQAAQQVLAAVGPTTAVSVDPAVRVAGQAAYQLVLVPKDSRSLVGKVTLALDGQHSDVPLRVQVFARGASTPAIQVGYTSVAFVKPAAANFNFTPPPGAKVSTEGPTGTSGGWSGYSPAQRKAEAKAQEKAQAQQGAPTVIGTDWLSVAVLPAGTLSGISGAANATGVAGQAAQNVAGAPGAGQGGGGENAAILGALLGAATPVHGAWGSGNLLRTSLVSVLILSNGKVLVGSVTPAVLYSAAAQVK